MENHSDTESTQLFGDWDSPAVKDTRKERGASTSTAGVGRMLPPWADPSYEWGGGKWKIDGRKNKKNKNKNKEKEKEKDKESDLSIEDLMKEYSSLPPQIAEWYWCIEYVAKFHKDLSCIFDVMNMGYPCTDDYGSRINEVVSLRILESLFDPTKIDATMVGPRIEFDFSLSSKHVLYTILQHITVSEARPGMPELSKFNLLPFISHKNMSLPLCALEMLRDVSAMENNSISAASPTVEPNDSVYRDEQPEQQAHTGLEQTNILVEDNVVVGDDPMQTNEGDEVIVIDGNDTSAEKPINNDGNTTRETSSSRSDVCVKCTKDGAWLICGSSDNESDIVKGPPRPENVCWKCERGGALLICSKSDCATKVHKECLNCPANFDEHDNFHCPMCWYGRATKEYIESQQLNSCAKRRVAKFLPLLFRASKRLK
ncbi:unnamed protein product [Eruca vesicaria subsp. sativa]|uniref:Zinc finger PHD-type domain-containing protein n=1 Tax=Eruca vesicaria subsp. sativa TaxID=29727 RepID=A0ABC8JTU5_ERUVS|nr:unnamed protein product [Eruca vesicaria subsp. sativa]